MTKQIAVYGTLKRGQGNNCRFGGMTFVGEDVVPGFQLYQSVFLPFAVKEAGAAGVRVELFQVEDGQYEMIDAMEIFAGYTPVEVDTHHGRATLWAYPRRPEYASKVEGRVWQ